MLYEVITFACAHTMAFNDLVGLKLCLVNMAANFFARRDAHKMIAENAACMLSGYQMLELNARNNFV